MTDSEEPQGRTFFDFVSQLKLKWIILILFFIIIIISIGIILIHTIAKPGTEVTFLNCYKYTKPDNSIISDKGTSIPQLTKEIEILMIELNNKIDVLMKENKELKNKLDKLNEKEEKYKKRLLLGIEK